MAPEHETQLLASVSELYRNGTLPEALELVTTDHVSWLVCGVGWSVEGLGWSLEWVFGVWNIVLTCRFCSGPAHSDT